MSDLADSIGGQGALAAKLATIVGKVGEVAKKGRNEHFKYDYVTAEDMLKEVRGPLADQKVALMPSVASIEERAYKTSGGKESIVTTVFLDFTFVDGDTGEMWRSRWAGQGDDPADKGLAKAYTNAIKTFLREQFLIPQGDDPEADRATDQRAADRASSGPRRSSGSAPSEPQKKFLTMLLAEREHQLPQEKLEQAFADRALASRTIEWLKDRPVRQPVPTPETDVPVDPGLFVQPSAEEVATAVPWEDPS